MENKSLKEDLEGNNRQIVIDKKDFEKLVDEMEKFKVGYILDVYLRSKKYIYKIYILIIFYTRKYKF